MTYKFIAISGSPGSGKSEVTKLLATGLGLGIYSVGDYWKEKWRKDCPNRELEFSDYWKSRSHEEQTKANEDATGKILTRKYIANLRYLRDLEERGGLLVFIGAPLEIRAQRALDSGTYPGKDLSFAKSDLVKRMLDEVKTGRNLYGQSYDFTCPTHYDLFLSSEKDSAEKIADAILFEFS